MNNLRSFECSVTGKLCGDARCKLDLCIKDFEAGFQEREASRDREAKNAEFHRILIKVAGEYCRAKKWDEFDPEHLKLATTRSVVRVEAERRFANPRGEKWPKRTK